MNSWDPALCKILLKNGEISDESYSQSGFMTQEEEDDWLAMNPLSNNDEDWDCEAGRPAHMRDEDRD